MFRTALVFLGIASAPIQAQEWPRFEPYDLPTPKSCKMAPLPNPKTEVKVNGKRLAGDGLIDDSRTTMEYCETFQRKVKQVCETDTDALLAQVELRTEDVDGVPKLVTSLSKEGIASASDLISDQAKKCLEEFQQSGPSCVEIGAKVIATFVDYREKLMKAEYCGITVDRSKKSYDMLIEAVKAREETELLFVRARFRFAAMIWILQKLATESAPASP